MAHVTDARRFAAAQRALTARVGIYPRLAARIERDIARFFQRSGAQKLLVGLSGGVDSAVVAALAVRAVGPEHVVLVTMPARKDAALARARLVARRLRARLVVIPVDGIVKTEVATINRVRSPGLRIDAKGAGAMDRMRAGNFASRARVAVLYDVQRAWNGRVLGTGNRTEYAQGYAAKYGTPISYDFGVLDELYKADVYALARVLRIPSAVIAAAPSTGYYPGQTHESELGASLEEQDVAAYLLFEKKLAVAAAARRGGLSEGFLRTMVRRWDASAHKRMLKQPRIRLGYIRGD